MTSSDDEYYYTGEFSNLIQKFFDDGGFDIGTRTQDELLWIKITYTAEAASYKQYAFFGWDNRQGKLWKSAFPDDYMHSREKKTVSGWVRYYNGMFPQCAQSSKYRFYNSSNQAKNAINVYKFYGTII